MLGWQHYQKGIIWQPANGKYINFWNQPWIKPGITLRSMIFGPLTHLEDVKCISDYRTNNSWNLSSLPLVLPQPILIQILAVHSFPIFPNTYDRIKWGLTPHCRFSVKSCYNQIILQDDNLSSQRDYSWIWKLNITSKIKYFLWLLWSNKLPTSAYLYHISSIQSPNCKRCLLNEPETIPHLLSTCTGLDQFWEKVIEKTGTVSFLTPPNGSAGNLISWLRNNLRKHTTTAPMIPLGTLILYCLWAIWTHRNKCLFENQIGTPSPTAAINLAAE